MFPNACRGWQELQNGSQLGYCWGLAPQFTRQGQEATVCLSLSPFKAPMLVFTHKRYDGHICVSLMLVTKSTQREVVPIIHKNQCHKQWVATATGKELQRWLWVNEVACAGVSHFLHSNPWLTYSTSRASTLFPTRIWWSVKHLNIKNKIKHLK